MRHGIARDKHVERWMVEALADQLAGREEHLSRVNGYAKRVVQQGAALNGARTGSFASSTWPLSAFEVNF